VTHALRTVRQRGALPVALSVALAAAAIGTGAGWMARGWLADRVAADVRAEAATLREQALHTALVETTRRIHAHEQTAQQARAQAARARADAAAARSAADSLRDAASAAAGRACGDTAVAGGGEAERLAHVLAEAVGEAERLAAVADRAIIAGLACEAAYGALVPDRAPTPP
jgi:hypothetical protein